MNDDERAVAWVELYDTLPDGLAVRRPVRRERDRVWAIYARTMAGPWHADGPWREAFGHAEAIALRALAQQFRNLHH